MHVTHSRFYRIVSGHILQSEGIGVLTGLGEKRVAQSMQASIRVRLDPAAQASHLNLEHPTSERLARVARVGEHALTLRPCHQLLQNLFDFAIDQQLASAGSPLQTALDSDLAINLPSPSASGKIR